MDDLAEKAIEKTIEKTIGTAWSDSPKRNHEKRNCSGNVNRNMDIILSTGRYRVKSSLYTGI